MLIDSAPCKLMGSGINKRFEIRDVASKRGIKLKGLTKRLKSHVFSDGELPVIARSSTTSMGKYWRGPGGGLRRGSAVDSQVSRLANCTKNKRNSSKMLNLTRMVFTALSVRGLEPVMGQRAVCSQFFRVGTAADIICYDTTNNAIVVVELKCGFQVARTAAAIEDGNACNMKGPLCKVSDSILHRHLAQLAVTHHMFVSETKTIAKLKGIGVVRALHKTLK